MTEVGASGRAAMVSGVDVDVLAAKVRSCHLVSDLMAGRPGSPATYLPGRRVTGIAVDESRARIEVRSRWGAPAHAVVAEIEDAVRPLVGNRTIELTIGDIEDPSAGGSSSEAPPPRPTSQSSGSAVPEPPGLDLGAPRAGIPPAS